MKIYTYKKENDLCLLKAFDIDSYYVGCIDLPQEDWTISQYNEWRYKTTSNLIALNEGYVPQIISHASLKIIETLSDTSEYYKRQYHGSSEPENVGKFDFKELLKKLYDANGEIPAVWNDYFKVMYQIF